MIARGRTLKFTAVIALVVLALSGFSTGTKSRHGSGSRSGGGGGCSSSSQDHDSTSSTSGGGSGTYHDYDDDDDYDDDYSGGSSGESSPSGYEDSTARLISCATAKDPYATIEVTNPNSTDSTFDIHITFLEADDDLVDGTIEQITVAANATKTVQIEVLNAEESAAKVDHCDLDPVASYNWDDVTGS